MTRKNLFTAGLEAIDTQVDDSFIEEGLSVIEKLRSLHTSGVVKNWRGWGKNKTAKLLLDELDEVIHKRFGFGSRHITIDFGGVPNYAVQPTSGLRDNPLSRDVKNMVDNMEEYLEAVEADDKDYVSDSKLHTYNETAILNQYINTGSSFVESMKEGVTVNMETGRIEGLRSDVLLVFYSDFTTLFSNKKITNRMILAILLHEIGHAFTHMSNSYRMVYETTNLLENIKLATTDGDYSKKLKLLAKKDGIDIKSDNAVVITYSYINEIKEKFRRENNNKHSYTDSEQQADVFATRFGMGADLAKALEVIAPQRFYPVQLAFELLEIMKVVFAASIYAILAAPLAIVLLLPFVLITSLLLLTISETIIPLLFGDDKSSETTYDNPHDRFIRIKNDLVRQLRTQDVDKKMKKQLIEQIDILLEISSKTSRYKGLGILERTGNMMPWNIKKTNYQDLEKVMESLIDNDLHVAAARLELLK